MDIDKWVALGACIAASVSALAALLAVKQSSLQRKLSYKPQLIFKPRRFDYEIDKTAPNLMGKISFIDADSNLHNKIDLVLNIGLGAALDIKIKWTYQSKYAVESLNEYLTISGLGVKLEKNDLGIQIRNPNGTLYPAHCADKLEDEIDYILSHSQSGAPQNILVPLSSIALNSTLHIYSMNTIQNFHWPAPSLTLEIEYKDIGGEFYKDKYDVFVDPNLIVDDGNITKIVGTLDFEKKRPGSFPMTGLEKLREKYADIDKEKDIYYYS